MIESKIVQELDDHIIVKKGKIEINETKRVEIKCLNHLFI